MKMVYILQRFLTYRVVTLREKNVEQAMERVKEAI
jgi:hypothetical protein